MERVGYLFPILFGVILTLCVAGLVLAIVSHGDWFIYLGASIICSMLFYASIKEAKGE